MQTLKPSAFLPDKMTLEYIKRNLLSTKVFIAIVVICSMAVPMHDVFYKHIARDEFFMALNVRAFQDSPMAPLTFYIGHVGTELFGDNLITLRVLKYLLYFITVGLGCLFFCRVTGRGKASWYLFALFSLTSCVAAMDVFNWDTVSYPFMVLTLISTLAYNHHRTLPKAALTGVCCGLMISSRIPSAVTVPFIILLIFLSHYPVTQKLRDTAGFLIGAAVTLWLILWLIYGSTSNLLAAWSTENIINGHGIDAGSISRMLDDIVRLSQNMSLTWMLSIACFMFAMVFMRMHRHQLAGIALITAVLFMLTRALAHYDETAHICLWQLPAFVFLFMPQISRLFGLGLWNGYAKISLTQWILLLFMLIPGVGSDHFYERIAPMVLMPLILAYCYLSIRRIVITVCGCMAVSILTLAMFTTITPHKTPRVNLASISPRTIGIFSTVEDANVYKEHKTVYDQIINRGHTPTYIGDMRYTYTYLFAPDDIYSLQHFHYINFANEKKYLKQLRNFDAVVVNEPVYADSSDNVAFRSYLHYLGFRDSTQAFTPLPSTTRIYLR